jgi:hypothetical protein
VLPLGKSSTAFPILLILQQQQIWGWGRQAAIANLLSQDTAKLVEGVLNYGLIIRLGEILNLW